MQQYTFIEHLLVKCFWTKMKQALFTDCFSLRSSQNEVLYRDVEYFRGPKLEGLIGKCSQICVAFRILQVLNSFLPDYYYIIEPSKKNGVNWMRSLVLLGRGANGNPPYLTLELFVRNLILLMVFMHFKPMDLSV